MHRGDTFRHQFSQRTGQGGQVFVFQGMNGFLKDTAEVSNRLYVMQRRDNSCGRIGRCDVLGAWGTQQRIHPTAPDACRWENEIKCRCENILFEERPPIV